MKWIVIAIAITAVTMGGLRVWRHFDDKALAQRWKHLQTRALNAKPVRFDPAMLESEPELVQRYFRAVIEPGALLRTSARITMNGQMSLGSKEAPNYMPMRACQLLAPPDGFIWRMLAGQGITQISGSDAAFADGSWTRFWLGGLLPVARAGGTPDHFRSAFGRYIAEAVFWTPAALLPSQSVRWAVTGKTQLRVTVTHQGLEQAVNLVLNPNGLPQSVQLQRWSNANSDGVYRLQSFGGDLAEYKSFDGYRLATRVSAGNFFGSDAYFPFFKATVDRVEYTNTDAGALPPCDPKNDRN